MATLNYAGPGIGTAALMKASFLPSQADDPSCKFKSNIWAQRAITLKIVLHPSQWLYGSLTEAIIAFMTHMPTHNTGD